MVVTAASVLSFAAKSFPICDETFGMSWKTAVIKVGKEYLNNRSLDEIVNDVLSVKRIFSNETTTAVPTISIKMSPADVRARPLIEQDVDKLQTDLSGGDMFTAINEIIVKRTFEAKMDILKEKFVHALTVSLERELEKQFKSMEPSAACLLQLAIEKTKIPQELNRTWDFYVSQVEGLPYYERYLGMENRIKEILSQFL